MYDEPCIGLREALLSRSETSPCCNASSVEIYSLVEPQGFTGLYKCLKCDSWFCPTWKEE